MGVYDRNRNYPHTAGDTDNHCSHFITTSHLSPYKVTFMKLKAAILILFILWYTILWIFRRNKIEKELTRKGFPEEIELVLSRVRIRYRDSTETPLSSNFLLESNCLLLGELWGQFYQSSLPTFRLFTSRKKGLALIKIKFQTSHLSSQ